MMNWKKVKLGEYIDIISGFAFDSEFFNDKNQGMQLVRIRDVGRNKAETYFNSTFRDEFVIDNGHLLIAMDGEFRLAEWKGGKALLNQRVCCIKTKDSSIVSDRYLLYSLPNKLKKIEDATPFVTVKHLSVKSIKDIEIPLPDLATQQHIAQVLDQADALRQQNRQLLGYYDELLQSTFIDLFGDPVKNEKGWEVKKLGEVCDKITDGTHQSPKFVSKGVPFLFVSNIIDNQINYNAPRFISEEDFEILNKRTPIEVGNILYTIVGSYGNPAIIKEEKKFAFQRHIAFLKPNHSIIDYTFLHGQLQSNYIKNQVEKRVKGIAQKTLNLSELKEIDVILPPLPLQQHFAKIVEEIEAQKSLVQQSLAESEALFEGLLAEYFG